jgi:hypothetical protein
MKKAGLLHAAPPFLLSALIFNGKSGFAQRIH